MISVKKDTNLRPKSLNVGLDNQRLDYLLQKPEEFAQLKYNSNDVKDTLNMIYHCKCAYCESKRHNAPLQIEHYRPKLRVKENPTHNGYYWLVCEWTNLLLACPDCNSQAAKGNRFPLEDENLRVYEPSADRSEWQALSDKLTGEKPLLLNPEIDTPEQHFEFLPNGEVKPLTVRGQATLNIVALNRDSLRIERKKKIDDIFRQLHNTAILVFEYFEKKQKLPKSEQIIQILRIAFEPIITEIRENQKSEYEFSRMFFFIFTQFEQFVNTVKLTNSLSALHKKIILTAFSELTKKTI